MTPGAPDFEALAQPGIRRLRAYDPGHDIVSLRARFPGLLEMGSNENPLGPSPLACAAIRSSLGSLHRYPDPLGSGLRHALARKHGLDPGQVMLGNGSHELLMMIAQVFAGPGTDVLASEFGFAVYAIAAQAANARHVPVPALAADSAMPRGHDLDALLAAVGPNTRLLYLANPNNPTGTWFGTAALQAMLARLPPHVIVVLDEAYLEYAVDPSLVSGISLLDQFPGLVVTRTFSKAYGLAGLRVGYACAHPNLLAVLERVRESFNVNGPALAACEAVVSDDAHLDRVRRETVSEREWLALRLVEVGLRTSPSQTNFLLIDFGGPAAPPEARLIERGIVLRPMTGYGLPNCLRATVGTRMENQRLVSALRDILS